MKSKTPELYYHSDGAWCVLYWKDEKNGWPPIAYTFVGSTKEKAQAFLETL
jgi:hypothetical protein